MTGHSLITGQSIHKEHGLMVHAKWVAAGLVFALVSACGGGDDEPASSGPELSDKTGYCGVRYPLIPSGKASATHLVADQPGQEYEGRYTALAAVGTGFSAGESFDLRIAPSDATGDAREKQAMGVEVGGPLLTGDQTEGSWCVQAPGRDLSSDETLTSWVGVGRLTSVTYSDEFPEGSRPGYVLEGFMFNANTQNPLRFYFNIDPTKYAATQFDSSNLGVCYVTPEISGGMYSQAACEPVEVTRTATGFQATARKVSGGISTGVYLVASEPRQ